MCLVCIDWQKGALTSKEALRNLGELINADNGQGKTHYWSAIDEIMDSEVPEGKSDEELDEAYWKETHRDD